MLSNISSNLRTVQAQLESAARQGDRTGADVTLIAVSKTQPESAVRAACAAGQSQFGENYLQEALQKIRALKDLDLCWHFIGRVQSNKTRSIAEHFDWVHTIDREKIAKRLSSARIELGGPPLNVCLQVNIDDDEAKAGIAADAVAAFAQSLAPLAGIRCRGLMTILAQSGNVERSYRQLADCYQELAPRYGWDTLSMGMSGDFVEAIACGSTMVRIGTAVFGPRRSTAAATPSLQDPDHD